MIPDGFGDPITGFHNAHRQTDRNTSYLTHTPSSSFGGSSSCGALAFASRSHGVSTFTTHFWDGEREALVFIYYGLVHGLDHGHVLVHGHGPVLGVVVWVDLGWRFG